MSHLTFSFTDDEILYRDSSENIVLRNVATRSNKVLLAAERVSI